MTPILSYCCKRIYVLFAVFVKKKLFYLFGNTKLAKVKQFGRQERKHTNEGCKTNCEICKNILSKKCWRSLFCKIKLQREIFHKPTKNYIDISNIFVFFFQLLSANNFILELCFFSTSSFITSMSLAFLPIETKQRPIEVRCGILAILDVQRTTIAPSYTLLPLPPPLAPLTD